MSSGETAYDLRPDAIVIGSGATGGVAALTLAENGARVLVIEAGVTLPVSDVFGSAAANMTRRLLSIASGRQRQQAQHPGYWKTNPRLYRDEVLRPCTYPPNRPFFWTQGDQIGGRSLTWGGITLRLSDIEFGASKYGRSSGWPIRHHDLEEHYTEIERLLGIYGQRDGLVNLPDSETIGPLPLTLAEENLFRCLQNDPNLDCIHSRGFATRSRDGLGSWPRSSSLGSTLALAIATGRVYLLVGHIAEHLVLAPGSCRAEGVVVVNRTNGCRQYLRAGLIVLCGSTIRTLQLLLCSIDNGLEDPSGLLGSCLMDHVSTSQFFTVPVPENQRYKLHGHRKEELSGAGSFFILPRLEDSDGRRTETRFQGRYGIWGAIGRFEPPRLLRRYPNEVLGFLIGQGEVLPQQYNQVRLSSESDAWDIPIPHIDCRWSTNEEAMVQHMRGTMEYVIAKINGRCLPLIDLVKVPVIEPILRSSVALNNDAAPPGYYIHEVGGAAMGDQEDSSVVDCWNRLWRCANVLVVDGACWPTSGWQSPTLTMMAITRRACIKAIRTQAGAK
ncbi:GMC family oxidoreductase [cyanobiont of Ornithocercus magnificus]|nr:GMC family oxidoreductase [cyanobiont of Ornithocercus magnificus]